MEPGKPDSKRYARRDQGHLETQPDHRHSRSHFSRRTRHKTSTGGAQPLPEMPSFKQHNHMNINQIKQSKFLARADVNPPILVTIKGVVQDNVAKESEPAEFKYCLTFTNHAKPMVLNNTNAQIIAQILKSEETDDWVGKQIVLYDDPNVSFGGKLVGGIRVRAPRTKTPPAPPVAPPPAPVAPVYEEASDEEPPF